MDKKHGRAGLNGLKLKRFFVLPFFLFCCLYTPYGVDWKQVISDYGEAVCRIEIVDNGKVLVSGSGFIFSDEGTVLTNAHVVKPAYFNKKQQIRLIFALSRNPEKEYYANIIHYSRELDLAVLAATAQDPPERFCELGESANLQLMDDVMVIGYPLGKSVKATPGYLQAFQKIDGIGEMLDISVDVDPGNSGGPVFNRDGKIIGIVTAELQGLNFNLALPVNLVKEYVKNGEGGRRILVSTQPDKARIFMNGTYRGESPLEINYYGSDFELTAEKEGYISEKQTVNPSSAESGELLFVLKPFVPPVCKLTIDSSPQGAVVLIDNREMGVTPLELEVRRNTVLRLRLVKKRYDEFFKEIEIGDLENLSVFYTLKK